MTAADWWWGNKSRIKDADEMLEAMVHVTNEGVLQEEVATETGK